MNAKIEKNMNEVVNIEVEAKEGENEQKNEEQQNKMGQRNRHQRRSRSSRAVISDSALYRSQ